MLLYREACFFKCIRIGTEGLVESAEILLFDRAEDLVRADNASVCRLGYRVNKLRSPDFFFGISGNRFFILRRTVSEEVEAVSEETVIGPVRYPGTDRSNGYIIYQPHDQCEDRQCQPAVGYDTVDLVGDRKLLSAALFEAVLHELLDPDITLICDDRLCVIVHL